MQAEAPAPPSSPPREEQLHELLAIAARAPNVGEFTRAILPLLVRRFASPCAAIELRSASKVIHERCTGEGAAPEFWTEPVERALTEAIAEPVPQARVYKTREGAITLALVAAPVLDTRGSSIGALALAVPCAGRDEARRLSDEVHALAVLVGVCADMVGGPRVRETSASATLDKNTIQSLRKAAEFTTTLELCYSIANNLRNKTGCERVALARVHGNRIRVECISGLDEVKHDSPSVRTLASAIEECLDHKARLVCQRKGVQTDGLTSGHRLHRSWHEDTGGASVATLPLGPAGAPVLIVALQRHADQPFRVEELDEIQKLVEPYVPALALVERARSGLLAHAGRSLSDSVRALGRPAGWVRAGLVLGGLAFVAWVVKGTTAYEIAVPARLCADELRLVGAPFDGVLAAVDARPGDRIVQGQLLGRLETREHELEALRIERQIEIASVEERRAFAARAHSDADLARARRAELAAELDLVHLRIARAALVAPFDGWVLKGDPAERIGSMLRHGEELFQLVPDTHVAFELALPETRLSDVVVGQAARFSPFARPEHDEPLVVTRIAPVAELREARNVFVLEALSQGRPDWLRPGMEGVAVLEAGTRPVWWVYTHQAVDWLRLNVWP